MNKVVYLVGKVLKALNKCQQTCFNGQLIMNKVNNVS